MQINISGHHLEVTDSIRDYVINKLDRLQRHNDQITSNNVILSVDKLIQKAEATVHVSGAEFFAESESEDLYAAIDQLADKLDRQLIKHKEKTRDRKRTAIRP
ncbi:MAG: ribosome-associated translation inhibitor RaiA [Cellvibrionaceae bacterium]